MKKKIQVKNLVLIYGGNTIAASQMIEENCPQEEILKKTKAMAAVRNVSFDVYEHEMLVIMGLSGSGKSSLIKCLNCLNRPTSGEIYIDDDNILDYNKKQLREYRQKVTSMVFQNFGLLPQRTVLGNIEFGLEICGVDKKLRRDKAMDMIKLVGLEGWENRKPKELSGGMQQRVGLARALANDPEILLMDEPFSALDPLIRKQMQYELLRLQEVLKKTIVFITHDIDEAFMLGDRVALMKEGEIQQIGTPNEIMKRPATLYVKDFTKDINKARVYRAGDIAKPELQSDECKRVISEKTSLEDVMGILAEESCVKVIRKDGNVIGYINRKSALEIFKGKTYDWGE